MGSFEGVVRVSLTIALKSGILVTVVRGRVRLLALIPSKQRNKDRPRQTLRSDRWMGGWRTYFLIPSFKGISTAHRILKICRTWAGALVSPHS
jgi:hypothetical protein